ncbi:MULTISPECIES: hypothetical protein [unclassified Arthrobacter]|uniref:hypothetical protein n=1 Tax=unclassified Arthrobacter TaxID=235627 RepID=UPI00159E4094|nr:MULTISPECIES: hypothetical protein [unclassified Arthrobacter]MCQ9164894.1 hypothetical protein [Arthrobacter sp. STN4]NVM98191.1 hypothetical protein [Arthrobacter sp. SDTb3-6]
MFAGFITVHVPGPCREVKVLRDGWGGNGPIAGWDDFIAQMGGVTGETVEGVECGSSAGEPHDVVGLEAGLSFVVPGKGRRI